MKTYARVVGGVAVELIQPFARLEADRPAAPPVVDDESALTPDEIAARQVQQAAHDAYVAGEVPIAERFPPEVVATLAEVPPGAAVEAGYLYDGVQFVAPPAPAELSHAALVEQAKAAIRVQRQPIIGVLDGLQTSALVKGNIELAVAIETAKQGLRDLTDLDLSGCFTFEEVRSAVKARYTQLAASLPADVRVAFSEAVS